MPTRQGWTAMFAGVGAVVVGRLFGLIELYFLGSAFLAAVVIALAIVNRPLPRLSVRRVARPATVGVGEASRVDIQVTNNSSVRAPRLALWEPVGHKGGAPMLLAPLGAGQAVSAAYRVPTAHRGVVRVGPLRAERSDPLGLASRSNWLAGAGEVLVVPQQLRLDFPTASSAGRLGEHLRMKSFGQTGSEFHSQREYVAGDDLRLINWKSSARSTTLIVRETALEGVQQCTVALDTLADAYDHDGFERAVCAAASVVAAASAAGIAGRLVAPGLDLRGPDVAPMSLRWLATVAVGRDLVDHTRSGRTAGDGLGIVVVVTSHVTSRAAVATMAAAAPDESVIVVCTMTPAAGSRAFTVDATSLSELSRSWRSLVLGQVGARA
ncbi:MAG: DUF58 domain-containing protein [Actinobacteria bacterium]|nr:DUF58 domain-containing protein [Actinomycetota bacterium]